MRGKKTGQILEEKQEDTGRKKQEANNNKTDEEKIRKTEGLFFEGPVGCALENSPREKADEIRLRKEKAQERRKPARDGRTEGEKGAGDGTLL